MKKLKILIATLLSVIAVLSPIITVLCVAFLTPPVYQNTFLGELDDKFERLNSIEGEKIVVVGGSSVAFGLDSALLEEHLGRPVVNFGLYAALGTKAMLDLSLSGIGSGDTVILAPELDRETLSLYFSSETMLSASDGAPQMLKYIKGEERLMLLGGLFKFASSKISYHKNGAPDPAGIYNSKSFNEYGDIRIGLRKENIMPLYHDPAKKIELSADILSEDFADYLNDYIKECKDRGAEVIFAFCPMNADAIDNNGSQNSASALQDHLEEKIDCDFVGFIDSYILDADYFYDTNFHLNDAGVTLRTKMLIEDITLRSSGIEAPPPSPLPLADVRWFEEDENSSYFTYEKMANGALKIVGLTELGKEQRELTIPLGAETYKVTAIADGAFSGSACEKVIVTRDTNLRNFLDGSFRDCYVRQLCIYYDFEREEDKLTPASSFYGIKIHVPPNSQYTTHYDWNDSSSGFELIPDLEDR